MSYPSAPAQPAVTIHCGRHSHGRRIGPARISEQQKRRVEQVSGGTRLDRTAGGMLRFDAGPAPGHRTLQARAHAGIAGTHRLLCRWPVVAPRPRLRLPRRPHARLEGMSSALRCLVTGASGYIGGRLVPELLAAGHPVRCMARDPGEAGVTGPGPAALRSRQPTQWRGPGCGALWPASTWPITSSTRWARAVLRTAGPRGGGHFADAAKFAGVSASSTSAASTAKAGPVAASALAAEVGEILLGTGVPTTVLRAAVILGSGSASFEMLRYLTERLPVMVTPLGGHPHPADRGPRRPALPRRLRRDARRRQPRVRHRRPGRPDLAEMMRRYAEVAGLRPRVLVPVPLLTPTLSSLWVGLVTPVPAGLARPLVESLRHEVVCYEHDIAAYVPDPPEGLLALDRAVALALRHIREGASPPAGRRPQRPALPATRCPATRLGRRLAVRGRAHQCRPRLAGGTVEGDRGHRRRERVVLLPRRMGRTRAARPARRRRRAAARTA